MEGIYTGFVKVKCIAHLDDNLNVTQIDISDIQEIQQSLL